MFKYISLILAILLSFFNTLSASENVYEQNFPTQDMENNNEFQNFDFELPKVADLAFSTKLAWHQHSDLRFQNDKSVYWNQFFRAEIGQISLMPMEYLEYNYNNETETADMGRIKEIHSEVMVRSGFYKYFALTAGLGYSNYQQDNSVDEIDEYIQFHGFSFLLGIESGIPLAKFFTIVFGVEGRYCEAWKSSASVDDDKVSAFKLQGEIKFMFEIFGKFEKPAFNIGLAFGYFINQQKWTIDGLEYDITPNNSDGFENGPSSIYIKGILVFSLNNYFNCMLEVTIFEVLQGRITFSYLFS